LEVFGEGEAACITARIYPPSGVLEAELSSQGGPLKVDLAMWKLQARS
jgi:sucrose-6-phosphate hydrolase SacC (GH32 family)